MSKNKQSTTRKRSARSKRRLSVRSELRREPDVRKLARAVIAMAIAQAEADAQAEGVRRDEGTSAEAGQ